MLRCCPTCPSPACLQADLSEFKQNEALTAQQRRERNLAHRVCLERQIGEVSDHKPEGVASAVLQPEGVAYTAAVLQTYCRGCACATGSRVQSKLGPLGVCQLEQAAVWDLVYYRHSVAHSAAEFERWKRELSSSNAQDQKCYNFCQAQMT